eukprot:scaffold62660_cov30-Tisochrysis_lutea.AAC.2
MPSQPRLHAGGNPLSGKTTQGMEGRRVGTHEQLGAQSQSALVFILRSPPPSLFPLPASFSVPCGAARVDWSERWVGQRGPGRATCLCPGL